MSKKTAYEEVQRFIRWLLENKRKYEQPLIDEDFYAVGMYAIYLAEQEVAVHNA